MQWKEDNGDRIAILKLAEDQRAEAAEIIPQPSEENRPDSVSKYMPGQSPPGIKMSMEGDQMTLFSKEEEEKKEDEDKKTGEYRLESSETAPIPSLKKKLIKVLSDIGVSVEFVDTLVERGYVDAVAVYDVAANTILVAQGKEDAEALPEEAAHAFMKALGEENPLVKRILSLVEETDTYQKVKAQYSNVYGTDEKMMKYEAAGHLLYEAIIRKHKIQESNPNLLQQLIASLKRLYNVIMAKFKMASADQLADIMAEDVLGGEIRDSAVKMSDGSIFYRISSDSATTRESLERGNQKIELKESNVLNEIDEVESDYVANNTKLTRASDLLKSLQQAGNRFNAEAVAQRMAINKFPNNKAEQDKFKQEKIREWMKWAQLGTDVHFVLEQLIEGKGVLDVITDLPDNIVENLFKQWSDFKRYNGIRGERLIAETRVANIENTIGGTIDVVEILDNGKVKLYDFKTSVSSTTKEGYKKVYGTFLDPLLLGDSKQNRHKLQLNIYRRILELGDTELGLSQIDIESMSIIPIKLNLDEAGDLKSTFFEKILPVEIIDEVDVVLAPSGHQKWRDKRQARAADKFRGRITRKFLDMINKRLKFLRGTTLKEKEREQFVNYQKIALKDDNIDDLKVIAIDR